MSPHFFITAVLAHQYNITVSVDVRICTVLYGTVLSESSLTKVPFVYTGISLALTCTYISTYLWFRMHNLLFAAPLIFAFLYDSLILLTTIKYLLCLKTFRVPLLVYFARFHASASLKKNPIHRGNFVLHDITRNKATKTWISQSFCCSFSVYILSWSRRTKRKPSETTRSADVETTSGARHIDQEARRPIDDILPLVNIKNNNGMVGAGRAVASWVDRNSGDRLRAAAADDRGQPWVKLYRVICLWNYSGKQCL